MNPNIPNSFVQSLSELIFTQHPGGLLLEGSYSISVLFGPFNVLTNNNDTRPELQMSAQLPEPSHCFITVASRAKPRSRAARPPKPFIASHHCSATAHPFRPLRASPGFELAREAAGSAGAMPPAITCPVKCHPHHRIMSPHPAAAVRCPLVFRSRPAAEPRASKRRRSPPSLSLSRAASPPRRSTPLARRARAAVAAGDGGGGSSAALLAGAQSRHAVFRDELVRRALSVAEAAHRGQVLDQVLSVQIALICLVITSERC